MFRVLIAFIFLSQITVANAAVSYLGFDRIQQSSDGSAVVTIPSGTNAIVACLTGYGDGSYQYLVDELNFDGLGDLDFPYIVGSVWSGYKNQNSVRLLTAADPSWPGSGSKTIYWAMPEYGEGLNLTLIYLSGVDQTSPVVGSDSRSQGAGWTSNISGVLAGDLGIINIYFESLTVDASLNSQTVIFSNIRFNSASQIIAFKSGDGALQYTSDNSYTIPAAIVLRADVSAGNAGFKFYNGSAWIDATAYRYDGSAWQPITSKHYTGSAWE